MNTQKIWKSLVALDFFYANLINDMINNFSLEIIDCDAFYNKESSNMLPDQTIAILQNTLTNKQYAEFEGSALEFCITNEYIVLEKNWNCIKHLFAYHKKQFNKNDLKYLKALNNSYVSVYQIVSVSADQSIELQDMIEVDLPSARIESKALSTRVKEKNFIATRLLQTKTKPGNIEYQISNTLLHLPDAVAQSSIDVIKVMAQAMNSPLIRANADFDTPNDRLLQKKLWIKEILEHWYIHHCNKTVSPVFH